MTSRDPAYLSGLRTSAGTTPKRIYRVVNRLPHDRVFTQGLAFHRGYLYESTGLYGLSGLNKIDPESGRVIRRRPLSADVFAEGLAVSGRHLVQFTWQSGKGYVYTADLHRKGIIRYQGNSWGSVSVDGQFIVSDGSSWLRVIDPRRTGRDQKVQVTNQGRPLEGLNELEYVEGLIYANIYPTDCVAQINPDSGRVESWLDLSGLVPLSALANRSAVANGVAYDALTGNLFVTGKYWPYLFELEVAN